MGVGTGINDDRTERIRRVMRRNAAHYDNPCFELFLWYPLPDGQWEILFGSGRPEEWHYHLWETRGIEALAKAWGIEAKDLWTGAGDNAIPTGYVDFKEENFRDVPFLILPEELPPDWTVDRIKDKLRCGHRIKEVMRVPRRSADPDAYQKLLGILKDLQVYRSVEDAPTIY